MYVPFSVGLNWLISTSLLNCDIFKKSVNYVVLVLDTSDFLDWTNVIS